MPWETLLWPSVVSVLCACPHCLPYWWWLRVAQPVRLPGSQTPFRHVHLCQGGRGWEMGCCVLPLCRILGQRPGKNCSLVCLSLVGEPNPHWPAQSGDEGVAPGSRRRSCCVVQWPRFPGATATAVHTDTEHEDGPSCLCPQQHPSGPWKRACLGVWPKTFAEGLGVFPFPVPCPAGGSCQELSFVLPPFR